MKSRETFAIFNRWGQQVYSSVNGLGWDGTFGGKAQDPDTYVWMARAIDYNGTVHAKKGTVLLIR